MNQNLRSAFFSFPQKKRTIKLSKTAKSDKTQEDKEDASSEKCLVKLKSN